MLQPANPAHLLVIDDDPMSRDLLVILLEAEGYEVEAADCGESALALITRDGGPPDAVLTDMNMPGIAGAALARKLRHACGSGTRLLAISGSQPPEHALSLYDGFLLKPFTMRQIAAALAAPRAATSPLPPRPGNPPAPAAASKQSMKSQVQEQPSEAAEAAGSVGPVLNEKIYQQLAAAMPPQQLGEMYALCVKDARERIARMRGLVATHEATDFIREAHTIKGSCGMLGATQLHGMAAELESRGLDYPGSDPAQEVNSLDELSAAFDRLERMLGSRV